MAYSPFDISDLFDQLKDSAIEYAPQLGLAFGGFMLLTAIVNTVKIITGGGKGGSASSGKSSFVSDKTAGEKASGNAGGGGGRDAETAKQNADKENEEKKRQTQDQLKELFELFDNSKENPDELRKKREEREQEEKLGEQRKDFAKLREQYKELSGEIASLLEKGLSTAQTAKALIARTTEQIADMDLRTVIEAMTCFLKKEGAGKTAVIGMDGGFERRAAVSALKRGEFDVALDFLSRSAEAALKTAESSHRSNVREPARQQAAEMYRAVAVLARPVDAERSFDALNKAKHCAPDNSLTDTMLARAYYESGKSAKAENILAGVTARGGNGYAEQYAAQTLSQIRTENVAAQATRIRHNYEERLADIEDRQATLQNLDLQKRAEVNRANGRFIPDDLYDRDNERTIA